MESSAYRRIREPEDLVEVPPVTFQNYIDWLLENSGLQGFRHRQDRELSDLELLAELQSVFVFGEGKIEKSQYTEIEIGAASKLEIMETLERSFGVTGRRLFNDFAGFALWNASGKPYTDFTAEDFLSLGLYSQQQGDHEKAISYYDKAIERAEESSNG